MPKKVVGIVLPYLKSRGTEKQAYQLAAGFIERGTEVVIFVVQGWGLESVYQMFESLGVRVFNVGPARHEGKKRISLHRVFPLARLIRKHRCAVVLSRAGMANRITGYAGQLAFIPTVAVLSSASTKKRVRSGRLTKSFDALRSLVGLGFPRWIVSVSQEGAEDYRNCYPLLAEKVLAIPNGVDCQKASAWHKDCSLKQEKFNLCFAGSLEISRKGVDILLAALESLVLKHGLDSASLVLIGTGIDELRIKSLVASKGLARHVIFAGEQAEPHRLMLQCQVFVLPSRSEGLPNALLEAMALGMCAVAADCDTGPREIVTNGVDGLLVPPGDPEKLAEVLSRVILDKSLRQKIGDRAIVTIEKRFSHGTMVDKYLALLTEKA